MSDFVTKQDLDQALDEFGVKVFAYFDKQFKQLDSRIDTLEEKFDHLTATLDAFLKRLDDIEKDNTARDAQLARLERWIETIAQKTGVKLEY
jgi:hypothetical protein